MNPLPYLLLMRPRQWVKNALIFAPAFFAGALFTKATFIPSFFAFVAFCLLASSVYVLNDLIDCEEDKKHPKKCLRPLPAGKARKQHAFFLCIVLALVAAGVATLVPAVYPVLALYFILNIAYSLALKQVPIVDLGIVASFYLFRIIAGGAAAAVLLSPWIILATFFLALFLAAGKRRGEYQRSEKRKALEGYAKETLDALLVGSAVLAIASYGLWTVLAHPADYAVYSVVPVSIVVFLMLNRLFLSPERGEMPEILVFTDRWVFALTAFWALGMLGLFYL